jgi:23S rRNA (adenine2503-C2)-methyltransferase
MEAATTHAVTLLEQQHSSDGSLKFLWQLADEHTVESIYFTFQDQVSTCISSQVGCNIGCPFCATGQQRVRRNLTAQEMVAQVEQSESSVTTAGGQWPLDQVALAGMGEPLLNFAQVITAATYLRSAGYAHTVSLSTSGIVPKMRRLASTSSTAVNKLFLSLHATTDAMRSVLVPANKKYPLQQVLDAARFFALETGTSVTATYLLFENLNDTEADVQRLIHLLDPRLFLIQLSEWNPINGFSFVPSPRLDAFQKKLAAAGFEVFIQRSKGRDIAGGCGQLRSRLITDVGLKQTRDTLLPSPATEQSGSSQAKETR